MRSLNDICEVQEVDELDRLLLQREGKSKKVRLYRINNNRRKAPEQHLQNKTAFPIPAIHLETDKKYSNNNGTITDSIYNEKNDERNTSFDVSVQTSRKKSSKTFRRNVNVKVSRNNVGNFDASQVRKFVYLQSRIYFLSSIIGDRHRPFNRYKGVVGLILWIINLILHFTFDFYEAYTVFHVSWASAIGVFLVMFIVCTIFLIRHTVRWFIKTLKKLSKEGIYKDTLNKLHFVFRFSPVIMFIFSVSGAAAQYGCYAYDDALTISFKEDRGNGTQVDLVPQAVHIAVNILRFTSLMHIYYMMFLLLGFALIIFFTIVHSQKIFNEHIGNELKAHPPSMTFQEAVDKVALRIKLLNKASENTTIIFSTLILATSLSFVVNAYNFLFIKRYAIYIWFAIAPLIWTVSILIGAAFVTSSYKKLKLVVMQSWVEIPEKYDEMWNRRAISSKPAHAPVKRPPALDWRAGLENVRRRRAAREAAEEEKNASEKVTKDSHVIIIPDEVEDNEKNEQLVKTNIQTDEQPAPKISEGKNITDPKLKNIASKHDDKINTKNRNSLYDNVESKLTTGDESSHKSVNDINETSEIINNNSGDSNSNNNKTSSKDSRNSSASSRQGRTWKTIPSIFVRRGTKPKVAPPNGVSATVDDQIQTEHANDEIKHDKKVELEGSGHFGSIVRIAQTVNKFTANTKKTNRRKFNYEKYIKFLELTLDTVGFSLGKVTITWDRVSFFIVLLMTLVGVFAQNAFLK